MPDPNLIVEVPVLERKVVVPTLYDRLQRDLLRFREELDQAGDPFLAGHISEDNDGLRVVYHPEGLKKILIGDRTASFESMLQWRYGGPEAEGRGGVETTMLGLQQYLVRKDGRLSVSTFVQRFDTKRAEWLPYQPVEADRLNEALGGLVSQHEALVRDRLESSAAGVIVPLVTKSAG